MILEWKLIENNKVILEGDLDFVISKLSSLGDEVNVLFKVNKKVIEIFGRKYEPNRSDLIRMGMKQRQLEEFRKHKYFIEKEGYKFCTSCLISKPVDEFGYRSDSKDGRARQCLDCVNMKAKKYRRRRKRNGV